MSVLSEITEEFLTRVAARFSKRLPPTVGWIIGIILILIYFLYFNVK